MYRSAIISPDGVYRYQLNRIWDTKLQAVAWICLNPSTADAEFDDPTVRKILGFSRLLGYGHFTLFNLFALRATNPRELLKHSDPVGPDNTINIIETLCLQAVSSEPPIIAWGAIHKRFHQRAWDVCKALGKVRCLGYTKEGHPRHPLMLPYTASEFIDTRIWSQYPKGEEIP